MHFAYADPAVLAHRWPPAAQSATVVGQAQDVSELPSTSTANPDDWIVDQPLVGFLIGGALSALLWAVIGAVAWMALC